jgi:hypothetical protein
MRLTVREIDSTSSARTRRSFARTGRSSGPKWSTSWKLVSAARRYPKPGYLTIELTELIDVDQRVVGPQAERVATGWPVSAMVDGPHDQ